MMAAPALPLGPQGGNVYGCDDNALPGAGLGLSENAAVEIDNHAATGPAEGRVIRKPGPLVGGNDIRHALQGATPIDHGPPV